MVEIKTKRGADFIYTFINPGSLAGDIGIVRQVGSLINAIMGRLAMEYPSLRSLSQYFTAVGLDGKGKAYMRIWDIGIYSPEVQLKINRVHPLNSDRWDEWALAFLD